MSAVRQFAFGVALGLALGYVLVLIPSPASHRSRR
jgi:hypothetical protein